MTTLVEGWLAVGVALLTMGVMGMVTPSITVYPNPPLPLPFWAIPVFVLGAGVMVGFCLFVVYLNIPKQREGLN